MKQIISTSLDEMQEKNMGHVAVLSYQYSNICIKADPCSLLGVELEVDGVHYNVENLAHIYIHSKPDDDDKIDLFPKSGDEDIPLLLEGVLKVHPEFIPSVEVLSPDEDSEEDEQEHYLRFTMPPVDRERKKLLEDAINVCYDTAKARIDAVNTLYGGRIRLALAGETGKTVEKVNETVQATKEKFQQIIDGYKADKLKELEEAYQLFLATGTVEENSNRYWGNTLRM